MKVLFLHPNFPGQFKNITAYISSLGHDVKFLCQTHYGRSIPEVERICLKGNLGDEYLLKNSTSITESMRLRSRQYKAAFARLRSQGWNPDVIVSHNGWGCGVYSRYIWPNAKFIIYSEWWYKLDAQIFLSAQRNKWLDVSHTLRSKLWERNQLAGLELLDADEIVTPSIWQMKQLPKVLQPKTNVISDGFDLTSLKKGATSPSRVLTYGTRGMEAVRGFPQFILTLPSLVAKFPELSISIAGLDNINYLGKPPNGFNSWKHWAVQFVKDSRIESKIDWVGYLPKDLYVAWLQNSWCHVYLSEPYIPSWSLIEAALCCHRLVVSEGEFTREFTNSPSTSYCDHNNIKDLTQCIINNLDYSENSCSSAEASSRELELLKKKVDLNASMKCWQSLILG